MFPLLAIAIMQQTAGASAPLFSLAFFNQPIDVLFYDLLLWFGWIPVLLTLLWGFSELWLAERQSKFSAGLKFVVLAIDVPSLTEQTPKALENLFTSLFAAKSSSTFIEKWFVGKFLASFSFEIISEQGYIQFIVRTQTKFRDVIEAGIYAQYPDAEVTEVEDYAKAIPSHFPNEKYDMWGAEFTLDKPSFFPIRTYVDFEDQMTGEIKDPLGFTLEQMSKMRPGEHFWFQMIIQPDKHDWRKAGVAHVNKIFGVEEKHAASQWSTLIDPLIKFPFEVLNHATSIDLGPVFGIAGDHHAEADPWKAFKLGPVQQDEAKAIMKKTVKVGYSCKIRIIYAAQLPAFKKGERVTMVKGILNQYTHLNLNSFKMSGPSVPKDDYYWQKWTFHHKQSALMDAYKTRSWGVGATPMVLNVEELATLWHFPTINIKAPLIKKSEARRAEPPVGLPVTFLENTLPGFEENQSPDANFFPSAPPPVAATKEELQQPLEEALPHVISPTEKFEEELSVAPKQLIQDKPEPAVLFESESEPEADAEPSSDLSPPDLPV